MTLSDGDNTITSARNVLSEKFCSNQFIISNNRENLKSR